MIDNNPERNRQPKRKKRHPLFTGISIYKWKPNQKNIDSAITAKPYDPKTKTDPSWGETQDGQGKT